MEDFAGFERLYLDSRDRLVLQVAALSGDAFEAMDHVQEAFVRAWLRWDRVGGYEDPEGWVRRVAANLAVSRWRRARRAIGHQPVERAYFDPDQLVLLDALRQLSERERRVVVLHHLVGYSVAEIAEELGAPVGTVKSLLSRGRARLSSVLDAEERKEEARGRG